MARGSAKVLASILIVLGTLHHSNAAEYIWTRQDANYTSENRILLGHVFAEIPNSPILTQCAYHCLQHATCKSFNLDRETDICQLSNGTDIEHPQDLQDAFDVEYVRKGTYTLEEVSIHLLYQA